VARGRTLNISSQGAYLITVGEARELAVGRRFHTEIGMPRMESGGLELVPVKSHATVRRLENLEGEWGIALQFDGDLEVGF